MILAPFRGFVHDSRSLERLSATTMVLRASLWWPGETLQGLSFQGFVKMGFDDASAGILLAAIGVMHGTALYINGAWPHGTPLLRVIGAVCGCCIFSTMSAAFAYPYFAGLLPLELGPSTGIAAYAALAFGDFQATYRATADVRLARDMRRQRRGAK